MQTEAGEGVAAPALIFGLGMAGFAGRVASASGLPLAPHEERRFEDGEFKVRPLVSVRDRDVYVFDTLHSSPGTSVHDRLCRLLFFIAAVKDAAAARVTAVVPYLCYGRKDRRTKSRDPVTTRYVAALLEAAGMDAIMTMDVHDLAAFQNAFRCRTEHLESLPLLAPFFTHVAGDRPVSVVSPDSGGAKRADALRRALAARLGQDVELAFLEKRRSGGRVTGDAVVGEVTDRVAIIVDDLISSGTTMARAAHACSTRGASAVWAAATHPLFNAGAAVTLAGAPLHGLVVLNTVEPGVGPELPAGGLTVLDAAPLVGEALRRLASGGSLVDLMEQPPPHVAAAVVPADASA